MKIKNLAYIFIAFILPWLLIISGVIANIYNAWLYVGSMTWFIMCLILFLSFYKI